ncbi:zinc finger protein ZAT9-like [Benincasa hispida]|uniref:zinc finger protein ZAT9-like n=1 Tax=Benincasa hispida TaxID=102211 RepID=UPI00190249C6|nr:zinc finger protein ZAT9-like [Benincasa hispida]
MELQPQDHQEQKQHLCKLCNKSFSNGKVLGGHMRSHRSNQNPPKKRKKNSIPGSYSLRENPKKSWKFSAPNGENGETLLQENQCKICGKGFDSSKALFGHMRHHSGRRKELIRRCKECNKEFENLKSLSSHMKSHCQSSVAGGGQSDGETLGLLRRKRSRRTRCKLGGSNYPYCCSSSSSDLIEYSSSSVVDVIEPDVEELAVCLLMLSKGVGNFGAEFSSESIGGSHFSGFEAKSPLNRTAHYEVELEERVKMEFQEVGYHYAEVELGMPKLDDDDESGIGFCEIVRENELKSLKKGEIEDFCVKGCDVEMEGNHQCDVCLKVFGSGQALGGHKRAHLLKPSLMELEEEDDNENKDEDGDEEEDDDDEFKPWLNGDDENEQQQQVMGLVSSN